MKKTILLAATLFYAFIALGDTIDYVQVYYNDALLAQFQPNNDYYNIDIDEATFKETDTIFVKYFQANGDEKSVFIYNVFNQKHQQLFDIVYKGNGKPYGLTRKYFTANHPLNKGNFYYFTIIRIINMAELPPQKCLKITFK